VNDLWSILIYACLSCGFPLLGGIVDCGFEWPFLSVEKNVCLYILIFLLLYMFAGGQAQILHFLFSIICCNILMLPC
jgi:hypothetical protein